jgi:Peptidase_C39 like family
MHHVSYTDKVRTLHRAKKKLFFEKTNVPHFTQLIFSWNALRPATGHFSFYAQVRNAETRQWGKWHHMADWGAGTQQSYMSKSDGFSTFVYVRLEIEDKKKADAFRIKIISHHNASLSLLYGYAIALSDFGIFRHEKAVINVPSIYREGVPCVAQFALDHEDNGRICSPVSCAMLVSFLTQLDHDPLDFARQSFDNGLSAYGSWPYNVAHAFECCKGRIAFCVGRMNGFGDVHQSLLRGIPLVVSVRGSLPGALKPFPHGHLIVVVGWDNETKEVLCHDPAAYAPEGVLKRYPIADFLRAWEQSHRLAYQAWTRTLKYSD